MTRPYSRTAPGKFGLLIDWETSGSNFTGRSHEEFQGVSFGALIVDLEKMEEVAHLYREIRFDASRYKWSEDAEKIHGLSREHLEQHGVSREEALVALLELVAQYIGTSSKITFIGHNVQFDIDFTLQLAADHDIELTPHHVCIETSGLSLALFNLYRSDDVFKHVLGLERTTHNALDDARATLQLLQAIRAIYTLGLEALTTGA